MAWHSGQAYGQDLRDRVLAAQGTIHAVAERYAVSDSYVARARGKRRRLGQASAGVQCNHVPPRLAGLEPALAAQVAAAADWTLWRSGAIGCSTSTSTACEWALPPCGRHLASWA